MHLQHVEVGIDGVDESDLAGQQVHRADPAVTDGPVAVGHLVADVAGREYRMLLSPPLASGIQSSLDSALASGQFLGCSVSHSKRLRACEVREL